MWRRIVALIRKEFIQMRRDRLTLGMMLFIPVVQLALYGFAINTDVRHVPLAVVDYSHTESSRRLIQAFLNSQYFDLVTTASSPAQATELIDRGVVRVALIIDPKYEEDLQRLRGARAQVLVDASDPQVAASTLSNSQGIGASLSQQQLLRSLRPGLRFSAQSLPVQLEVRAWYNPDLVTATYIVPGLVGVILTMTMMMITSMAIVREREMGTLEQLSTTPLQGVELVLGKIIPYIVVGYVQMTVTLLLGTVVFDVPIRGNLLLLYSLSLLHIVAYLGLGLLISTISKTQQQAMQMSFFLFLPTLLLSGFMFPREGMPTLAQKLGLLLPLTYFLQILRGIVLKGLSLDYLWQFVLPLAALMVLILTFSVLRFNQTRS